MLLFNLNKYKEENMTKGKYPTFYGQEIFEISQ